MLVILALIITDAVSSVVDVPWWAYLILIATYILSEAPNLDI